MALQVGSRLGHCNVTSLLGKGGMGQQVWQATEQGRAPSVAARLRIWNYIEDDPSLDAADRLAAAPQTCTAAAPIRAGIS